MRESNSRPLAPKARIIPLDQSPDISFGGVAHSVERSVRNRQAQGSKPCSSTFLPHFFFWRGKKIASIKSCSNRGSNSGPRACEARVITKLHHPNCYAVLCYGMLGYAMLSYAMLCYAMLCYAMLCYGMAWYGMLCYGMVWYGRLCYAMLCYAMLCYAMLWYAMVWYAMVWCGMLAQHSIS